MDYTEVELYGRKFRYFNEENIKFEFRNIKNDWRKISITMSNGYNTLVINFNGKNHHIKLHRLIFFIHFPGWNIYDGSHSNYIDHIDGDPSNNNIANLRCVTNQENNWNRTKAKGYYWRKDKNKWWTSIRVNKKLIHLGYYDIEEDARSAYLEGKKKFHCIKGKVFEIGARP